jgi:hypothetical protein
MQRVQRGYPATMTFRAPGATAASVDVVRDDGTVVLNDASATDTGSGSWTFALPATATAELDLLRVVFTATIAGDQLSHSTSVEVVGGFLFALDELREHPEVLKLVAPPTDEQLGRARTWAEQRFEAVCRYAFVPRYAHRRRLALPLLSLHPYVRVVRALTVDGQARPGPWTVAESGILRIDARGAADVSYEHGLDGPDLPVAEAVLTLAKTHLVRGPVTDRATQIASDAGAINLATPGLLGSRFGIPEVDEIANEYRYPAVA